MASSQPPRGPPERPGASAQPFWADASCPWPALSLACRAQEACPSHTSPGCHWISGHLAGLGTTSGARTPPYIAPGTRRLAWHRLPGTAAQRCPEQSGAQAMLPTAWGQQPTARGGSTDSDPGANLQMKGVKPAPTGAQHTWGRRTQDSQITASLEMGLWRQTLPIHPEG